MTMHMKDHLGSRDSFLACDLIGRFVERFIQIEWVRRNETNRSGHSPHLVALASGDAEALEHGHVSADRDPTFTIRRAAQ
jgi:hypothetical protein